MGTHHTMTKMIQSLACSMIAMALLASNASARSSPDCPLSCPVSVTQTVSTTVPSVVGLLLTVDYGDPVPGTAKTDCSTCTKCTRTVDIDFSWTGTPAARFQLQLENTTGTATIDGSYSRTGILYRGCKEDGEDFLNIDLLDNSTSVYSNDSTLSCACTE